MKEFLQACNTPYGRWNRKKFWLYPLGLFLLIFIPIGIITFFVSGTIGYLLGTVGYIYMSYVSVVSYLKRLRDLDKNPWMTLLIFVPFVNIYIFIICGFFKGTQGPNKFGPDPLGGIGIEKSKQEKIEL